MSINSVKTKLKVLDITHEKVGMTGDDLEAIVITLYEEQADRMRNYLNYAQSEPIPRPLEHIVDDWAVGRVIAMIRLRNPEYGLYLQTIAEGHVVRKYAPKGGYFVADPSNALDAVPWEEIVKYRKMTRGRVDDGSHD